MACCISGVSYDQCAIHHNFSMTCFLWIVVQCVFWTSQYCTLDILKNPFLYCFLKQYKQGFVRPPVRCPWGPHVGHVDLSLLCSQIWPPPQSLHFDLPWLCRQIPSPLQSLQRDPCLPCSQIWHPPQSLHCGLCLPCLHLICCLDILQVSKHFTQHFVNGAVRFLILKQSNNISCLHFVHCFFSIFINIGPMKNNRWTNMSLSTACCLASIIYP